MDIVEIMIRVNRRMCFDMLVLSLGRRRRRRRLWLD